jgi:N-acetylmuramoyl-L-alanine amidase
LEIIDLPSPNFGARRDGARPDLVVLHYTAMVSAEAALARLRDPEAEVSAHYLVGRDGRVWRMVAEEARAWHAGVGSWGEVGDVNSRSIGIELDNAGPLDGFPPFPEAQMVALEALIDGVRARWEIPAARVIGHSDMAPGRKIDPGPKFDWARLARAGRVVRPGARAPVGSGEAALVAALERAGYRLPAEGLAPVLGAFRLRFRPTAPASLPADGVDLALAQALAAEHPCVDRDGVPA